jgi:large repetitive protein
MMKMLKNRFFLKSFFLLLLALPAVAQAQNFSRYNWYFGSSNQAIRFSRSDNSPNLINYVPNPTSLGTGGSAVASSKLNGDLLFYTDGVNVFDITNQQINPAPLNGNASANQPVAIAKVPGQVSQYYIFTNSANNTTGGNIEFSIVDMSLPGNSTAPAPPSGAMFSPAPTGVVIGRSEAMITVPHSNGEDFWLITHANGTADFTVVEFTSAGPGTITSFNGFGLIQVAANFSYHEKTGRIAVSPQETTRDIEIFDFDNTTGLLSSNLRVLNSGLNTTLGQAIYDTEWSNSGDYLYVSVHGDPTGPIQADVLQFDYLAASQGQTPTLTSILPTTTTISRSYGLQMAPDSAIYHLYQQTAGGPFFVGKLTNNDTIPTEVLYTPQAFAGTVDFGGTQFPSFTPSDTTGINVSLLPVTACANTPVAFTPTVTPGADSVVWDFGDGSGGSGWSPIYTYTAAGTYQVTATAFLNGESVTSAPQAATISQFDLQLSLVQDTTACVCEYKPPVGSSCNGGPFQVTVEAQNGSPTFQWFGPAGLMAGQNTATLTPDSAGYYYVVATVGACSMHAGVNIKTYDSLDQRANIWYFGQNAGLDFNGLPNDPVVAISNPVMDSPEGTSTISDRNGQVIFFTDGDKVWNRTNVEIASGIGGSSNSTQSSLIVPFPGDETLYYIFTTTAIDGIPTTYELRYSVFDLKLNGGTGGLVDTDGNPATFLGTLLFTKSTERITSNGNWLIAHEFGNNSFRAYPLTSLGIGNPVISSIGSDHVFTPVQNGQGYMELGSTGNLAVALSTPGTSNTVEIFDFVDSTGVVTNYRVADLKIPSGQVYGLEFSGSKLFATWNDGTNSKIVEFFFNAGDTVYSVKQPPIDVAGEQLGAIQSGPDGQVYVAVEGATSLGTIQVNGDTTLASTFTLNGFPLAGGTSSHLGLPNFVQILANPTQQPGVNFTGVCLGNPTDFFASGKDSNIDKFDWNFGDGTAQVVDGGPQISHTYALPGTYPVTVKAYNKCEDPIPLPNGGVVMVTISAPPAAPTILQAGDVPVLCTGSKILEATPASNPNLSNLDFLWTTGATTRTITADQQAIYGVTITDNLGCSSNASLLIADNRPQVDLPPNTDVCQNIVLPLLDAQNPVLGTTYAWTITTGGVTSPAGTIQQQSVDTSNPGVFEYEVTVTSPGGFGCNAKDSVIYTVKQAPDIANLLAQNTSDCALDDGRLDFQISGPPNSLYSYFITGPLSTSATDQVAGPIGFPSAGPNNLPAGNYGITLQDQVSFCFDIDVATINDPSFTITSMVQQTFCDPIILRVFHTAVASPITYRVIDVSTSLEVIPSTPATAVSFDIVPGLPAGDYIVEVTSNGCIFSLQQTLVTNPIAAVSFNLTDICNGNLTAESTPGGAPFDWTASQSGSLVDPASTLGTVALKPGTWNIIVTANGVPAGSCPGTATTVVTYENFTAALTQSDPCQDQVTLDASPAGTFTYEWTRNGLAFLGGQQVIATLADNNATYAFTATSTVTGCPFISPTLQAKVDGLLDVVFTNTPPCEGLPFTITATPSRVTNITTQWTFTAPNQSATILPDTDLEVVIDGTSTATGEYSVTVTSTNIAVCKASFSQPIRVEKSTPGLLNEEAMICPEGTDDVNHVVLRPGAGFVSYNWLKEEIAIGVTSDTLDVFEIGNYSVELENQFGCFSTDKTLVVEECDPVIVGPTAFRPTSTLQGQSGDMTNQSFRLFTFFIADEDFQVFIFNRWGEMIYQTNQRDFRWNGGYNNDLAKQLPSGTYSYVVRYKSEYHPEDGVKEKHGGVVLLK